MFISLCHCVIAWLCCLAALVWWIKMLVGGIGEVKAKWPKLTVQHPLTLSHTGFIYLLCSSILSPETHMLISQLSHPASQVDLPSKHGNYFTHVVLTWCLSCPNPCHLLRNTHISQHIPPIKITFVAWHHFSVIPFRHQQHNHIRQKHLEKHVFKPRDVLFWGKGKKRYNIIIHMFIFPIQVNPILKQLHTHDKLMTAETTMELMLTSKQSQKPLIWLDYYKLSHTWQLTVFTIFAPGELLETKALRT